MDLVVSFLIGSTWRPDSTAGCNRLNRTKHPSRRSHLNRFGIVFCIPALVVLASACGRSFDEPAFSSKGASVDLVCPILSQNPPTKSPAVKDLAILRNEECGDVGCYYTGGDDRRRSVLMTLGEQRHARISLDTTAQRLRFSTQLLDGESEASDLRLRVWLRNAGADEEADPVSWEGVISSVGAWVDHDLDVTQLDGSELTISLEVSGSGQGAIAVGMPRLINDQTFPPENGTRRQANIMLYLIDTLRTDRLSIYGYSRATTPFIDEYFSPGLVFTNAYSTASWTRPAAASLLTSLYPSFHGANVGGLADEVRTLAERFRAAGWSTSAFVTNGNVFAKGYGFDQGFDRFVTFRSVKGAPGEDKNRPARSGEVNVEVLAHMKQFGDEPFFLFIHSVDPHEPYDPPEEYRGLFTDRQYSGQIRPRETKREILRSTKTTALDREFIEGLYDEDIRYQDDMFNELIEGMEDLDLADDLLTVLTSDHGEEFYEHGDWGHGKRAWEEVLRIPLLITLPKGHDANHGLRVTNLVQIVDIMPTLLKWFGIDEVERIQGDSLDKYFDGGIPETGRLIYTEEPRNTWALYTLRRGSKKLVIRSDFKGDEDQTSIHPSEYLLFDLVDDPGEQRDLASREPEIVSNLFSKLLEYVEFLATKSAIIPQTDEPTLDEATRRHLEALGYLDTDAGNDEAR